MGGMSPVHWLIILVPVIALQAVPIVRILGRAGVSGWWAVAYFVPFLGWISLWAFAFTPWPRVEQPASTAPLRGPVGGV